MGAHDVGGILQRGGTILQTRRSERFKDPKGQREAIRRMNEAQIDGLIVIGGDGSLRGAQALSTQGIKVIGIPASIDNDIWGSDMAIGVDTALNTIMEAVDKLRDTASSHSRAFLYDRPGTHDRRDGRGLQDARDYSGSHSTRRSSHCIRQIISGAHGHQSRGIITQWRERCHGRVEGHGRGGSVA